MKTAKDYQGWYLKCNVLFLADAFENLKITSIKNYELYLSHCLSALDLSWNAIINMTKLELELMLHVGMYLFFEKGM